jgi:hypothetical protein
MRFVPFALAAIAATAFMLTPMSAQHTVGTKFVLTKPLTLKGTVTQVDWANPYTHIVFKVPGAAKPVVWAVELENPILLKKSGWSATTVQPGDVIRFRDLPPEMAASKCQATVVLASSGKSVLVGSAERRPRAQPCRCAGAALAGRTSEIGSNNSRPNRLLGKSEQDGFSAGRRECRNGCLRPFEKHRRCR